MPRSHCIPPLRPACCAVAARLPSSLPLPSPQPECCTLVAQRPRTLSGLHLHQSPTRRATIPAPAHPSWTLDMPNFTAWLRQQWRAVYSALHMLCIITIIAFPVSARLGLSAQLSAPATLNFPPPAFQPSCASTCGCAYALDSGLSPPQECQPLAQQDGRASAMLTGHRPVITAIKHLMCKGVPPTVSGSPV